MKKIPVILLKVRFYWRPISFPFPGPEAFGWDDEKVVPIKIHVFTFWRSSPFEI